MSSIASSAGGEIGFVPLTGADLPFLVEIRNECRSVLHDDRRFTVDDARQWFEMQRPEFWLIQLDGVPIGYFRTSCHSSVNRSMMVGADLHKDYRQRGLGYRSWCAFLNKQFVDRNLNKVALEVLATNARAHALYSKLGFVVEGVKRREILRDNEWVDSILMAMLSSEWRERDWFRG